MASKKITTTKKIKLTSPRKKVVNSTEISVLNLKGEKVSKVKLPSKLQVNKPNSFAVAQAIRVYLANQRKGQASSKTRGEVEGSTRKIYRQKGTGRARHGAIRAPIFVGGGIVFGPKPRDFRLKLPKKIRHLALANVFSDKVNQGKVIILRGLLTLEPKTKIFAKLLEKLPIEYPLLLISSKQSQNVQRATRNIAKLTLTSFSQLNTYQVISAKMILIMEESLGEIK